MPAYQQNEKIRPTKSPAVMTFGNSMDAGANGIDEAVLAAQAENAVTISGPP